MNNPVRNKSPQGGCRHSEGGWISNGMNRIFVKVKPNSKTEKVGRIDDAHFVVSIKEPPTENKANFAVLGVLADYLGVAISRIRLVSGKNARNKVFEVL